MSLPPFTMSKYISELDLHKDAHAYYKAENATLRARIAELTEARPMETAPKDGSLILITESDGRVVVAAWGNSGSGGGMGPDDWGVALHNDGKKITWDTKPLYFPIGWLPLPQTKEGDQA